LSADLNEAVKDPAVDTAVGEEEEKKIQT